MRRTPLFPLLAAAMLTAACSSAKRPPESLSELATMLDYRTVPRLPSPIAGNYARLPYTSPDPVLRPMLEGKRVDASLMGAATALALDALRGDGGLSRWELREAAWGAGYAYPILEARAWSAPHSAPPPQDLLDWLDRVPEDQDLGLIRARGTSADAWVGVRAAPKVELGTLPREANLGTELVLPPVDGATFAISDGSGQIRTGPLDAGHTELLATSGEWLIQLRRDREELARFPVYVGIKPPTAPIFRTEDPTDITSANDAKAHARALLEQTREAFGLAGWQLDPMANAAASSLATTPSRTSADVLPALGLTSDGAVVWRCRDVTVEDCLDRWVWDVRRREDLLSSTPKLMGLDARIASNGLEITLLLTGTL